MVTPTDIQTAKPSNTDADGAKPQASGSSILDRFDELYRVTVALFVERGYDNTPLSLIAKELGVSKAGLYHHFESKEQLLFQIHKHSIEETLVPVLERAERESDPLARLKQYLREYAEVMVHDPGIRVLIEESKRLSPENLNEIRAAWRRGFEIVRSTIAELQAEGIGKKDIDPTIAAFAAIGMCSSTPYWFSHEGPHSIDDVGNNFTEIFCRGALQGAPSQESDE